MKTALYALITAVALTLGGAFTSTALAGPGHHHGHGHHGHHGHGHHGHYHGHHHGHHHHYHGGHYHGGHYHGGYGYQQRYYYPQSGFYYRGPNFGFRIGF